MSGDALEVNFDGLVGPTHNYSGLSYGNTASMENRRAIANPREAALQGLEKMKALFDLGIPQGVLPPHERPYLPLLRELGYGGSEAEAWERAADGSPELIYACSSAAAMWAANAATVSPSSDSADNKVHFTPANLTSKIHRSIEAATTGRILHKIFSDRESFQHHAPLPGSAYFSDEGAANHTRFCRRHPEMGVQLFVWGRSSLAERLQAPVKFPARQTLEASQAVARRHRLAPERVVFAQQNPAAVDVGVFHNDVIAVGNQNVFLYHEEAFADSKKTLDELSQKVENVCKTPLIPICVPSAQIPMGEAVATYLFNSQLITLADGSMALIAPGECRENGKVRSFLDGITAGKGNPIQAVHYLNLRESMRNGGGPACLRLRVVLTRKEMEAAHQGVFLTEALYAQLKGWVVRNYRDRMLPQDLADPQLIGETRHALDELTTILQLGPTYGFQR